VCAYNELEQGAERTHDNDWHVVDKGILDRRQYRVGLHFPRNSKQAIHKLIFHDLFMSPFEDYYNSMLL
jgi:hypothetical protein